jgi:chromosome segregation ATPase
MKEKLEQRIKDLQAELKGITGKMNNLKQTVANLNQQGERLATEATFINGKIEQCQELLSELEGE